MTDADPSTFPRRILLATVGLAPQIITETLCVLCSKRNPPFIPTEIHLITTADGAARAEEMLLALPEAQLARFAAEYDVPQVVNVLTTDRIRIIRDKDGKPLSDIVDESGNAAAADLIIQTVHELTNDEDAALHVSIAGGRKTMGFLLGSAMNFFGRSQDRLSHVLVQPQALEQNPDFFFPPKKAKHLPNPQNPAEPISTAKANIVLADISFLRLRQGMPQPLLDGAWTYTETVARAQAAIAAPELILHPASQHVRCRGTSIPLTPMQFAIYAVVARRRLASPAEEFSVHWTEIEGDEFIAELETLPGATLAEINDLRKDFKKVGNPNYEDPRKSRYEQAKFRLNERLRQRLGPYAAPYELKTRNPVNGQRSIGFDLPAAAIRFAEIGAAGDDSP